MTNFALMSAQATLAEQAVKVYAEYRNAIDAILREGDSARVEYKNDARGEAAINKVCLDAIRQQKLVLDAKMKKIEQIAKAVKAI